MLILAALSLITSGLLIGLAIQSALDDNEIANLKSQLKNDANGHVKRGPDGRFESAKA